MDEIFSWDEKIYTNIIFGCGLLALFFKFYRSRASILDQGEPALMLVPLPFFSEAS